MMFTENLNFARRRAVDVEPSAEPPRRPPALCLGALALFVFHAAALPVGAEDAGLPRVLAELRFAKGVPFVTAPVRLGEREYTFLVDTGASATVYHTTMRPLLGPRKDRATIPQENGQPDRVMEAFAAPDASVGGLPIPRNVWAACTEFKDWRIAVGCDFHGILGRDLLAKHIVQFDCDEGMLRFLSRVPDGAGERMEFTSGSGMRPTIEARAGSADPAPFLVDTGFDGAIGLPRSTFALLSDRGEVRGIRSRLRTTVTRGRESLPEGQLRTFRLSELTADDLVASAAASQKNLIGMHHLSRFVMTVDFPQRAVYLKRGKDHDRLVPHDFSGLRLGYRDDCTYIYGIAPLSRAFRAGFKLEDIIIAVDGVTLANLPPYELSRLLEQQNKTLAIDVERNGQPQRLELKLRSYQPAINVDAGGTRDASSAAENRGP